MVHDWANKNKQYGRIIAAQTSALTKSAQRLYFCSNLSVLLRNTTLGRDTPLSVLVSARNVCTLTLTNANAYVAIDFLDDFRITLIRYSCM